jgi:hypothetical protein
MRRTLALSFLVAALSACAPWVLVEAPQRMESHGFEVTLPPGWRRATFTHDTLLLTRDSVILQQMRVERVGIGTDLKHTKKRFSRGMLPLEVAEVELDDVRSDPGVRNFELLENTPFTLSGLQGFKLVYTFKTEGGLRLKRLHHGVMVGDWVYRIQFQAPVKHYFDRDLPTFEQVRESFKIIRKA